MSQDTTQISRQFRILMVPVRMLLARPFLSGQPVAKAS
jgi:hypothetical protein